MKLTFVTGVCVVLVGLLSVGCEKSDTSATSPSTQPSAAGSNPSGGGKRTIAAIPKGTTHVFWKTVESGARKAADEAGVNLIWKGPLKEDDRAEQIKVVEQFVSEGVAGICLAPLDTEALARPVKSATGRKIPVVIFDSSLAGQPGTDFASYVATNNTKGGEMGGQELARLMGGKGKAVLMRYLVGSGSTTERENGFLNAVKSAGAGIEMISDNRYGGATVASAKAEAMKLIDQVKQADGVFCSNEPTTLGMLGAMRDNGLAGKIKFVGFDATPPLIEALQKGELHALIAQDPQRMGYLAVKTCVAALNGEKVEPVVDTGVRLITQESLKDPEIRKFLNLDQ